MTPPNVQFFGSDAEKVELARAVLSHFQPNDEVAVRAIAQALKSHRALLEPEFLKWARPYGLIKAQKAWDRARADPDALQGLLDEWRAAEVRRAIFRPQTACHLVRPANPYRVKNLLPAQGFAAIYGASRAGKSFFALALAAAIAAGELFFGYRTKAAPVVYVPLEGQSGVADRIKAWERHFGRPMPDDVRVTLAPFTLCQNDVSVLASFCPQNSVVIIDTLSRATPGVEENSTKEMGEVVAIAARLQELINGLVIVIAHSGKNDEKGLRGSSSLFAALDTVIKVSRDGDSRSWTLEKCKDGPDGAKHPFRLIEVMLGQDEDGDEFGSCVAVEDGEFKPKAVRLSGGNQLGMRAYFAAVTQVQSLVPGGDFGVSDAAFRAEFYKLATQDKPDSKRKAYDRALNDLCRLRHLVRIGEAFFAGPNIDPATVAAMSSARLFRDSGTSPGHGQDWDCPSGA